MGPDDPVCYQAGSRQPKLNAEPAVPGLYKIMESRFTPLV